MKEEEEEWGEWQGNEEEEEMEGMEEQREQEEEGRRGMKRRRGKRQTEEEVEGEEEEEEDHVGIQRCFLIQLVAVALPWRLRGRRSYKTKISATKAAGGCWLRLWDLIIYGTETFPRLKDK